MEKEQKIPTDEESTTQDNTCHDILSDIITLSNDEAGSHTGYACLTN